MKSGVRLNRSSSILRAFLFSFALLSVSVGSAVSLIRCAQAADEAPSPSGKSAATSNSTESNSVDEKNSGSEDTPATAGNRAKSPAEKAADRKAEEEDFQFYKSLADTIDQVERNYVKPIDRRELMEAAIKGVLSKLDPYSNYIGPDDFSGFRTSVESQFGGIGIQVTPDDGQVKVSSPLVGTPAYKAGVLAGDRILSIEGQSTRGMTLDEVVRHLKGDVGTEVTFSVRHALSGKEESFTIKREVIHVDTVMGDSRLPDDSWNFMLDPEQKIGYIRITAFSRDTATDLKQALEKLQQQKMRGLILDLRFNPGGLLTSAVEVCNLFIHEGRIVSTKGRNTPERVWDATPSTKFEGFPMVVLVNEYSASASEIVSACLQDHHRATIIGERTWGKGSVQNVIELEDGKSALKLTTATYTRPNGHNIHRFPDAKETDEWGVKPDDGMEIKLSDGELASLVTDRHQRDVVLGKAHEEKQTAEKQAVAGANDKSANKSATTKPTENSAEKADKPASTTDDGSASQVAAKLKSATAARIKVADRQLKKAIDYLSTELARAP